jgi:hypothetical protein
MVEAEEKADIEIDDWLTDLEEDSSGTAEEAPGELDQADLDALIGDSGPAPPRSLLAGKTMKAPPNLISLISTPCLVVCKSLSLVRIWA